MCSLLAVCGSLLVLAMELTPTLESHWPPLWPPQIRLAVDEVCQHNKEMLVNQLWQLICGQFPLSKYYRNCRTELISGQGLLAMSQKKHVLESTSAATGCISGL